MNPTRFQIPWERLRLPLLLVILPLLVGLLLAAAVPRPVVGIIYLYDAIYAYSARDLVTQIDYARQHPEVRAVVLVLDSPGGTVADTEGVYLELARLRQTKPVVASIGSMAASGAYYLAAGTDYIYAKPTSAVGNVGVIGYLPPAPVLFEDIASTGPYKMWGAPRDTFLREMEMIKQGFYQAVVLGRGERLQIDAETLLSGQIWPGSEALQYGLVDALGAQSQAVEHAARLARIHRYQTADLRELAGIEPTFYPFFYQSPEGITFPYPSEPGLYLLYVPPLPAGD
jgi:protease IV